MTIKKRAETRKGFTPKICIAGGRNEDNTREIEEVLREKNIKGKALLVTEIIKTGHNISRLLEILNALGIDYDVAAVSTYNRHGFEVSAEYPRSLQEVVAQNRLYYGAIGTIGNSFYDDDKRTGVIKDMHSKSPFPRKSLRADPVKVTRSRQDASVLANRLYEIIREEK